MLTSLFSPFEIKGKTLRNRTVVPAMVMNFCNADGTCTERFTAYHEAKAKGGFGMIITEDFAVMPQGKGFVGLPGLWDDRQIAGFKECTEQIHKQGAVFIAQIYHAGRQTSKAVIGEAPWAPTAIPCPFSPDMPREMTKEDIHQVVNAFGDCARRAEEAGFDGIEIHGGHGYLVAQFMSSYSNKRTDEYGGSLQNRIRFALEIIKNIRSKVSPQFIVGFRISADEFVTGGRTIEDTKTIVPYLEKAGIDYVHVTAGVYRSFDAVIPSMYKKHAWIADLAKEVKEVTNLPVITVGRYNDPRIADTVIKSGKADLVAMGRQSLADPETPNKAKEGRFDDIRTCIGCHHGCVGHLMQNIPGSCILNPYLGHESEYKLIPAEKKKKILVIGAGPAGLEAAMIAAQRGHDVKVVDRNRWAGGTFRLAAVPPSKGEIADFINWQVHECRKAGVVIEQGVEVDETFVADEKPDVVIAAVGASPIIPKKIPGWDKSNVVTAESVLQGTYNTGANVVVVGGGLVGAETANHLASNLKNVTLIEMLDDIAKDEEIVPRWGLLADMKEHGVTIYTKTAVQEITDTGVVTAGQFNGEIAADTVVLAIGSRPNQDLAHKLEANGFDVRLIGNASVFGNAGKAIKEGFDLGNEL